MTGCVSFQFVIFLKLFNFITCMDVQLLVSMNVSVQDEAMNALVNKSFTTAQMTTSNQDNLSLVSLLDPDSKRRPSPCCSAPSLLSCQEALVDSSLFTSRADILLPGTTTTFTFSNTIPPHGHHYTSSAGGEATITLNPGTGNMFGAVKTGGRAFSLENCGAGHVWIEYNQTSFESEDERFEMKEEEDNRGATKDNMFEAASDSTTMVEFSVMIYYTRQFAAVTPDIPGFVDQVLAETNQGYSNSQVPMTIRLHCIEEATMDDIANSQSSLTIFSTMKGSAESLRHTADTAVLLVASMGSQHCGIAWVNTIGSGNTASVVAKSCALGYYSFGHELGHNFGAYHNRETGQTQSFRWDRLSSPAASRRIRISKK